MSTTFGVKIDKEKSGYFGYEEYSGEYNHQLDGEIKEGIVKVAFRNQKIRFINPIAHLLPEDTEVVAMDNSQQGINTIGDINKQIKKQENGK